MNLDLSQPLDVPYLCGGCNRSILAHFDPGQEGTYFMCECGFGQTCFRSQPNPLPVKPRKEYTAKSLLTRAAEIVSGSRAAQHGPIERNHQNIADHWNAYLGPRINPPISALDVALMLAELKIARAKGSIQMGLEPNPDNFVDLAGYAGVAGEIALNGGEEKK